MGTVVRHRLPTVLRVLAQDSSLAPVQTSYFDYQW